MNQVVLQALIAGITTLATLYFAGRKGKKKDDAETKTIYLDDQIKLETFYKQDVKDLRAQLVELEKGRIQNQNRIQALETELSELRLENEKCKRASDPQHLADVAHSIVEKVKDEAINNNVTL